MAAVVVAVPGAAAAQVTPAAGAVVSTDKPLDKQIEKQLKADPSLKHASIHVSVNGNVATLTGTVPTEADKVRAARIAKMGTITEVDNRLVVAPERGVKGTTGKVESKTKEGTAKAKEGSDKAIEKSKEGVDKAWDKTKEGVTKAGDEVSDAWLLSKIKMKFMDEGALKGSDINVDVDQHVVTLKGTVPSEAARAKAMEIAKNTDGAKRVIDRLTIAPK
jgi:osmotically-inducible protein OsmY